MWVYLDILMCQCTGKSILSRNFKGGLILEPNEYVTNPFFKSVCTYKNENMKLVLVVVWNDNNYYFKLRNSLYYHYQSNEINSRDITQNNQTKLI